MRRVAGMTVLVVVLLVGCAGDETPTPPSDSGKAPAAVTADRTWPQFRGPTGDGIAAATARLAAKIDPATDTLWKTPVPAEGHSSPIVWGDRIFLTGEGHRIMAFDTDSGELLWNTALQAPPEPPLGENEWPFEPGEHGTASATACTDGEGVYAFFSTGVIGCVNFAGEQIWVKQLVVRPPNIYGLSAGPVTRDGVVVQLVDLDADEEGDEPVFRSFIVGLCTTDGEQLWRQSRPVYGSWGSPLLIDEEAGAQVVTCAAPWTIAYDPATGEELWRHRGVDGEIAATPVATAKRVYAFSDPTGSLLAIRRGGRGELGEEAVDWIFDDDLPEVPSGIVAGGKVVFISASGRGRGIDAGNGQPAWMLSLPETVYASPVLAASKLMLIDTEGTIRIVDPDSGEVVHQAELGESVTASPAIVGTRIYIRTSEHLICLGRSE